MALHSVGVGDGSEVRARPGRWFEGPSGCAGISHGGGMANRPGAMVGIAVECQLCHYGVGQAGDAEQR